MKKVVGIFLWQPRFMTPTSYSTSQTFTARRHKPVNKRNKRANQTVLQTRRNRGRRKWKGKFKLFWKYSLENLHKHRRAVVFIFGHIQLRVVTNEQLSKHVHKNVAGLQVIVVFGHSYVHINDHTPAYEVRDHYM